MSSVVTYDVTPPDENFALDRADFGILSPDEIRKMAVVEINVSTLYSRGVPVPHGVLDHRMGTGDRRLNCGTCGHGVGTCSGHWGVIELPLPVIHATFGEIIRKILCCVCYSCGRLKLTEEEIAALPDIRHSVEKRKRRLANLYHTCRQRKTCVHCNAPCPLYRRPPSASYLIRIDWSAHNAGAFESEEERRYYLERPFDTRMIHTIFKDLIDTDVEALGFVPHVAHPRNMILTNLLVPPPIIRPCVMMSEGSRARGQDDLTIKLQEIVKRCGQLRTLLQPIESCQESCALSLPPLPDNVIDVWNRISNDVATYMYNNPRGAKVSVQRSGIPTKCLLGRLKGKTGRIRGNLMGKRVNFSGRSVISPDALIDIDQVGVPRDMATQLTVQETVAPDNMEAMSKCVEIGAGVVGGASTIIQPDGTIIHLEFCKNRNIIKLECGWIIERYLQNDDWVMFNRQPSLHRNSLMGHRVVIMPGRTLRLSLAVVGPYNADFDGDEMNIHVPQSPMAIAEVRGIMSIRKQIVSPQAGRPVMGIVQDALVGSYLLSHPDTLLCRRQVMSLMAVLYSHQTGRGLDEECIIPEPAVAYRGGGGGGEEDLDHQDQEHHLWTGKQIFDLIFPYIMMNEREHEHFEDKNLHLDDLLDIDTGTAVIREGRFLSGILTKKTLGATRGGIIHTILICHGNDAAANFMGDVQRVVNRWLLERGFSIGIGDCVPSKICEDAIRDSIDVALQRIDSLQAEMPQWSSAALFGGEDGGEQTSLEGLAVERTIHKMVSNIQNTGSLLRRETEQNNALRTMVDAGSKGNLINISQIMMCVGQNCVGGNRIAPDGKDKRTLPSYPHGSRPVDGAGFVANSYITGLRAGETFFHAAGGREGLVDTAVKTSRTGYIQRRLVKGMEGFVVKHDLSVRAPRLQPQVSSQELISTDSVLEFIYGGDGMNPVHLERIGLAAFAMSDSELERHVLSSAPDHEIAQKELAKISQYRDAARESLCHPHMTSATPHTFLPINPRRAISMARSNGYGPNGVPNGAPPNGAPPNGAPQRAPRSKSVKFDHTNPTAPTSDASASLFRVMSITQHACKACIEGVDFGIIECIAAILMSVKRDGVCVCEYAAAYAGHPLAPGHELKWKWKSNSDSQVRPLDALLLAITELQLSVQKIMDSDAKNNLNNPNNNAESDDAYVVRIPPSEHQVPIGNILRRAMITSPPALAIDRVDFELNTSPSIDETLAHRLALIPIQYKKGQMPEAHSVVTFDIDLVVGDDAPSLTDVHSTHFKSNHPDFTMAFTNETTSFPVTKLAPGQHIKLQATATLGYGHMHSKFSTVSAVGFDESAAGIALRIEPVGQLKPSVIVKCACTTILQTLHDLRIAVNKNE